tara:strand:+ start:428 stop:1591 length:1164 start_codon:yes stop_codon:yes gene_type:complete
MVNKEYEQKGGDRRFRRDMIAFYDDEEIVPYDINESSSEQIRKVRAVLEKSQDGNLRVAFSQKGGDKQIHIFDKDRLYLKIKRMSIKRSDENIYAGIWRETFVNSPPKDHYFVSLLLCVKGIFRDGDLELPLVNIGVAIENENEARVSIPDRVFKVFDQYKYTGELGDADISSEKTSRLNLNEGNKLLEIIELLDHHSEMNLNSVEGIGMTVHSSNDFAKFFYSLFSSHKGLSLEESFSRVNSPLAKLLSQEYEYFKKNKPEKYEKGIETESTRTKVSQTETDESYSPSSSPRSSPLTPLSQTSSRTEVGLPLDESDAITIESCLLNNPCLKLIYDELKSDERTGDRGAIRKKRKKSSKKKKKRTKKKSSKKKSSKKKTKKRTKKKK